MNTDTNRYTVVNRRPPPRWLAQMNQTQASAMLAALGGSDAHAAQALALAKGQPRWQGEEPLLAQMLAMPEHLRAVNEAIGRSDQLAALRQLRSLAAQYAALQESPAPTAPAARLARLEQDYAFLLRALEADSLETGAAPGEPSARQLLTRVYRDSVMLRRDAPGPVGERAHEIERAADVLFRIEEAQRRDPQGSLSSARAERDATATTAPGTSVTGRRLAAMRDLMARFRVPESFRTPLWEARLLEDAMMHFRANRGRLIDGFDAEVSDLRDGSFTPAQRMQIIASPLRYFDYLAQSPAGWQQVAEQRLNKAAIFERLQREAENHGVLRAPQMRQIEAETDPMRRLYLFREAATAISRMGSEYSSWTLGKPTALQSGRPSYTSLVEYYLGGSAQGISPSEIDGAGMSGFGALLGSGRGPRLPHDARLQAATLDFIGGIERELALRSDPPAVQRALETIDARIAGLRAQHDAPQTSAQQRVYLDHALRVLNHLRSLVVQRGSGRA
jgi:hypothetical protein